MLEKIIDIIAKQLRIDVSKISKESNIIEDLGADSLDLVEMLMTIEDDMGIVVADDDAADLKTVGDVAEFIERAAE